MLSNEQRNAARQLLIGRPPVIAGTRIVADSGLRSAWYRDVTGTMVSLRVSSPADVREFCDLAGVPD